MPEFDYCKTMFSCSHIYVVATRIFDPSFVSDNEGLIDNSFWKKLSRYQAPLSRWRWSRPRMFLFLFEYCSTIFIFHRRITGLYSKSWLRRTFITWDWEVGHTQYVTSQLLYVRFQPEKVRLVGRGFNKINPVVLWITPSGCRVM